TRPRTWHFSCQWEYYEGSSPAGRRTFCRPMNLLDIMPLDTTKRADDRKIHVRGSSGASLEALRVIPSNILARPGRKLARVLFLLPGLVLLSGCDPDPYPVGMSYPPRADLLVLNADGRDIPQTFGPGQLDVFVGGLRD